MNNNDLRDRLQEARRTFHATQRQFAKPIGVTSQLICMMESGKAQMSYQTAMLIEHEYGINHEWLLTGEGEMMRRPKTEVDSPTINALKSFPYLHKVMDQMFGNLGMDDLFALEMICAKACHVKVEEKAS